MLRLLPFALLLSVLPAQTRLLRYPDLHASQIVFCYGSDLWKVSTAGGLATRLTAHPGLELFPKFSPDGKWIAFTGQIDGDEQVYVIPSEGGEPRQLTFYPARGPLPDRWGYDNQVHGWTPDGQAVVFRSLADGWTTPMSRLYTVKLTGGLPKALPMPVSGAGDYSPDMRRMVYSPLVRDFRTWKRYEGGWAQDLWLFDLQTAAARNLTNHPRTDRDPMWIGAQIWFASDRTGTLNLYRIDPESGETTQETASKTWDVRWPSKAEDARIVYEIGGELAVFDCGTRQERKVLVQVPDDGLWKRPSRVSAEKYLSEAALSPHGERVLVVARGDVFTVPVEHGPVRNLTHSCSAHDKHAVWSPDGRQIAFVSDLSGEEQLYVVAQDGNSAPTALTTDLKAMLYTPAWSPDGKQIAISDKDGRLYVIDVATRQRTLVDDEPRGQLQDFGWSPCSGWICYSKSEGSTMRCVWLWSCAEQKATRVTSSFENSRAPVFDPKGERLFFLGNRSYAPRISGVEFNYAGDRQTGIFALALRTDVKPLFGPRSDEVKVEEAAASKPAASKPATADAAPTRIDRDGLAQRVEQVPVGFENWNGLDVGGGHLFYLRAPAFYYGREPDTKATLFTFDLGERKQTEIGEAAAGFTLSADGKKLLLNEGGGRLAVMDATPAGKAGKKSVSLAKLEYDRVPAEEWLQIFDEVWRRFRDFFYAENMHGYDWEGLRAQYRPLVAHVAHRADLNYVIGEMIAELNAGHAYIVGGDQAQTERPRVALPGCRFELDEQAGRYRITRILTGQNDDPRYRAPLTEIGVDARPGDYVLAIDGVELRGDDNPYRLLRHKGDHPVTLLLNEKPAPEGARKVAFRPLASEDALLYWSWTNDRRAIVDFLSHGKVGYLHIPDMGADGLREWIKWYYPLLDKEGLVIDARYNGGGNISRMLIERLRRVLLMGGFGRTTGFQPYPDGVFPGHLVCLLNENSASDGDIFPAMFRRAKLGPLVGKRSWGGIVGITNRGTLLDGGITNVPEFANTELDGEWTIEGHGVDPDFVVENDPGSLIQGRDPQLEKAVELVLKAIAEKPVKPPVRPPLPVKR